MNRKTRARKQKVSIQLTSNRQLAVVRGLVRERTQQLGTNSLAAQEVFTTRHCRNSYGVVVRETYDPVKHWGMPFEVNRMTKVPYVSEVIE